MHLQQCPSAALAMGPWAATAEPPEPPQAHPPVDHDVKYVLKPVGAFLFDPIEST